MSREEGTAGGGQGKPKASSQAKELGDKACWADAEIRGARVWRLDSIPKTVTRH